MSLPWEPYEEGEPGPPLTEAEAGAFPETPQTATLAEWCDSPLVRRVLEVVGPPDGTLAWRLRFMDELLGLTEAVAEAKKRLRIPLEQIVQWDADEPTQRDSDGKFVHWNHRENPKPRRWGPFITKTGLTIEQAARFYNVDPLVIAKDIHAENPAGLIEAERKLLAGRKRKEIIVECGVPLCVVRDHAARLGDLIPRAGDKAVADRCKELRAHGLYYKDIAAAITAEFGITFDQAQAHRAVNDKRVAA